MPVIAVGEAEQVHLGLLPPAQVEHGGPEEHGLVVGVRDHEQDPLGRRRDGLQSGVGPYVGGEGVEERAKAQDGGQDQRQLFHGAKRGREREPDVSSKAR